MVDLAQTYNDLANEIAICSVAEGELKVTEFFRIYSQVAAENGDCPDLEYTPVLSTVGTGYRVDGYALELPEGVEPLPGDLHIAVCLFSQDETLPSINARDIDAAVSQVERYLKVIASARNVEAMEEASPAYMLAMQIRHSRPRIARVRVVVFTNAHLKTRKKSFESRVLDGIPIQVNVFDIERYERISRSGLDPVEVDFKDDFEGVVPCLPASMGTTGFSSYLFVMHAPVLAKVFAAYGNRLLEQNVRTYLQAKTSVNKGILKTIKEDPSMFFAYNNGLTGTASTVVTELLADGSLGIASIKDFQIVNGGQTTASLLYARDTMKCDLGEVYVQVKLSVVGEEKLGEVVPRISEYANTQNKVSLADLASNSPVQVRIERLSKDVTTPQQDGQLHTTRWFYERARGQYKNLFVYKSAAIRSRLEIEYPKNQLVTKTELAKHELAFEERPYHVSEGEQKCFQRYISFMPVTYGDGVGLNEFWFRCVIAKAIAFRTLDKQIAQSDWYKDAKGLKAQTIAYTLAAAAHSFRTVGMELDLPRIWREQSVPVMLLEWMLDLAKRIQKVLNKPPGTTLNPGEFCKKDFCWTLHVLPLIQVPSALMQDYGISSKEFALDVSGGRREENRNRTLDFDIAIVTLQSKVAEIRTSAEAQELLSENSMRALEKLQAGRFTLTRPEKQALKSLLDTLKISY